MIKFEEEKQIFFANKRKENFKQCTRVITDSGNVCSNYDGRQNQSIKFDGPSVIATQILPIPEMIPQSEKSRPVEVVHGPQNMFDRYRERHQRIDNASTADILYVENICNEQNCNNSDRRSVTPVRIPVRETTPEMAQTEMFTHICQLCGSRYAERRELVTHLLKTHPASEAAQMFTSKYCLKQIRTAKKLRMHELKCCEPTIQCYKCQMKFSSKGVLLEHLKSCRVGKSIQAQSNENFKNLYNISNDDILASFPRHKVRLQELYNTNANKFGKQLRGVLDVPSLVQYDIFKTSQISFMATALEKYLNTNENVIMNVSVVLQ